MQALYNLPTRYAINLCITLLAMKNIPISHYGKLLWHYLEVLAPIAPLVLVF
jgi:hypothetical protein